MPAARSRAAIALATLALRLAACPEDPVPRPHVRHPARASP